MPEGGVGSAVRRARLAAGLTQRALADRAGLSLGALRDLEQGRSARPKDSSVAALAAALGVPAVDLVHAEVGSEDPAPRDPVAVRALGPLAVRDDDGLRPLPGRGQALTLGLLALHVGEDVGHLALTDLIWPGGAPDSAALLLRSYTARLRRRLTPLGLDIASGPGRYRLVAPVDACDVSRFRADVRRAENTEDPARATDLLCDALGLWSDDVTDELADLRTVPRAVALERERARAAVRCAEAAIASGRPDRAVDVVGALAAADPLDESLAAAAISLLAATGRMADVHTVHTRTRRALADDLGLDPGPELAAAFEAALHRTAVPETRVEPPPPAPSPVRPPAQLPRTLRGFHGRSAELERVVEVLAAPPGAAPPVVVVSGMGGLGKTTFAVAVAHAVAHRYPDGQLFTDLDGVGQPLLPAAVLEHFLVSLGHDRAALPGDLDGLVAAFRTSTAASRCLVVLDNAASSEQVETLLPAGPGCGVLVTSRRSLSELDDVVSAPLPVLAAQDALDLLAAGIGRDRVEREPEASAKIVALCDGLPLALRMVVARLTANPSWRVADVADLLGDEHVRLDVLRSGSRAVRASFDLSHRALDERTARLFRLAAVVPGLTFAPASVAAAAGAPAGAGGVAGVLDDLVDRGLLGSVAGGRYSFHDLVRAFAEESGAATPDDTAHARAEVLRWLESTARAATARLFPHRVGAGTGAAPAVSLPPDDPAVLAAGGWLDAERETLAAAVHAAAALDPALGWRLADAASGAFRRASTSQEWERAARAGLAAATAAGNPRGTGLMHELVARAYVARCDHAAAVGWFEQALAAVAAERWPEFEVSARENLGISLLVLGRQAEAVEQFETVLRLARTTGQRYWEAAVRNDLGNVAGARGRIAEARTHYRAALAMNEELGDALGTAVNLANLAHTERLGGRPDVAWEHIVAGLAHHQDGLDRLALAEAHIMQGEVALDLGRTELATRLATHATGATAELEQPDLEARAWLVLARVAVAVGDVDLARSHARNALGLTRRVHVPEYELDAHLVLAAAELAGSDLDASRQHVGAAAELADRLGNAAGGAEAELALARVLVREGEATRAREHATAAEATFAALGHGRGLAAAAAFLLASDDTAVVGS